MDNKDIPTINTVEKKGKIHFLLSGDYIIFFFAFVLGVIFDLMFPNKIFANNYVAYLGLFFAVFGSIFIYWAQITSKKLTKNPPTTPIFNKGPYKYTRNPTHSGVVLVMFGCAILIQSVFSIIFLIIAQMITVFTVLKKQDQILSDKYGEDFENYKKKVKNWL